MRVSGWQGKRFGGQFGNVSADGEGCGGGGRGGVEHVNHALGADNSEIVDEGASGVDGLGANAGPAGDQVGKLQLGHEAAEGVQEGALAEGAIHFAAAGFPVLAGHAPEAAVARDAQGVGKAEARASVPVAGESQDGVGPGLDAAVDHARKVDAEEGEPCVGNGINEIADEALARLDQLVVFAAEGNDLHAGVNAAETRHAIRLEPAAVH